MYVWSYPSQSLSTWDQQRENALEEMKSIKNVSLGMKSILGKPQSCVFILCSLVLFQNIQWWLGSRSAAEWRPSVLEGQHEKKEKKKQ